VTSRKTDLLQQEAEVQHHIIKTHHQNMAPAASKQYTRLTASYSKATYGIIGVITITVLLMHTSLYSKCCSELACILETVLLSVMLNTETSYCCKKIAITPWIRITMMTLVPFRLSQSSADYLYKMRTKISSH